MSDHKPFFVSQKTWGSKEGVGTCCSAFFSARYIYYGERSADSGSPATPFIAIPAQSDRVYSTYNKCCEVYWTKPRWVPTGLKNANKKVLKVRRTFKWQQKRSNVFFLKILLDAFFRKRFSPQKTLIRAFERIDKQTKILARVSNWISYNVYKRNIMFLSFLSAFQIWETDDDSARGEGGGARSKQLNHRPCVERTRALLHLLSPRGIRRGEKNRVFKPGLVAACCCCLVLCTFPVPTLHRSPLESFADCGREQGSPAKMRDGFWKKISKGF